MKKVLIIGGGFAGIKCALDLAKQQQKGKVDLHIRLVSDLSHFEYHASLYKVVTGCDPLEVCIPLAEIFKGKPVEGIKDKITGVDLAKKCAYGESESDFPYDYLVLAVGSQTAYFDIAGLEEHAYGFKSINEALVLKKHIHDVFTQCSVASNEEKSCATHFVIIGAGPAGVEIAGELAVYTKKLAKQHQIDESLVTIDLFERESRVLAFLPEKVSQIIQKRLRGLGINIYFNQPIVKSDLEKVYLRDMQVSAKTVIWTAGVKPNTLVGQIEGLSLAKSGRVEVDGHLHAEGHKGVYIAGDCAATQFSGVAQTAFRHGEYIARHIVEQEKDLPGKKMHKYLDEKPFYIIPVGPGWALYMNSTLVVGKLGWFLRRVFDLRVILTILPFFKALGVFKQNMECDGCESCNANLA